MENKIKIGIISGAGYTGGELLRILVNHAYAEIIFVNSRSNAGTYIYEVHTDLIFDTEMRFSSELDQNIDVLFLCNGHGDSLKFLEENRVFIENATFKIIDLSQDFRPQTQDFVYGLPELQKEKIKNSKRIANPGCFATCIQLALLPLASAQLLDNEIHISATTGSTGAGQALAATSHFSWRQNNMSVYKAFEHQHLKEITKSLQHLQSDFKQPINFIPYRGDFARGIIASIYTKYAGTLEDAKKIFHEYYQSHPFVKLSDKNIDLKQVVNTNNCLLYVEKHGDNLLIISVIDNLLKGASGQAVQNMNLIFGLNETEGLKLKANRY